MPKNHAEKPPKRSVPAPSDAAAAPNEGEGNRGADRNYRRGLKQFLIDDIRVEDAAQSAKRAVGGPQKEDLSHAEQLGKEGPRRKSVRT